MAAMTTPAAELPTTLAEAHALILALAEERAAIEAENSRIASEMATLTAANADLAAVNQAADESGLPTEALLAQIAVAKYADGLPLYRQEAIYARDGVDLDRSLMAQWMGKVGFELQPLADYVLTKIKQGERIFADETTLPTLAPGTGKTQKAWLWAYARDDRPFGGNGPPMVAYRFEDSRGGECVERHLAGFAGILQVDGYAAYHRLARPAGANEGVLRLAACFAHVRRRFYELHVNESSHLATQTVTTMAELWAIEAKSAVSILTRG
jgi:transposase